MLLSVFTIPSPPPIGTAIGTMAASLISSPPKSVPTLVSMAMAAVVGGSIGSSATRTPLESAATLQVAAPTAQPK